MVYNHPEPHIKTGEWVYTIERQDPFLKVPFVIADKKSIRILTVINERKGRGRK